MLRKSIWAAGIAALTASVFAFSATSALAAPRGGHGGGGHVGGVHAVPAHGGGVRVAPAHVSGYRGGYAHYGHDYDRGRYYGYGRGLYGLGVGLYAGYPSYYGGYYGYPSYGSAYYSENYYPSTTTIYTAPPSTSYYYNPSVDVAPSTYVAPSSDMTATIGIHVPADAQVWFDGTPTQQLGEWREFASPPLEAGKVFHYDIRVRWMDNGKPVEQTRRVDVRAGQLNNIDFTRPEPAAIPPKP